MSQIFSSGTIKSTQTINIQCENNDHLKDCKHGQYNSLKVAPFKFTILKAISLATSFQHTYSMHFLGKCHNVYNSANHAFLFTFLNYYSFQLGLLIIPLHFSPCIPCCQTRLLRGNLSDNIINREDCGKFYPQGLSLSFKMATPDSFYSAISKNQFLLNEQ